MGGYYKITGLALLIVVFMGVGLWLQIQKKRKAEAEGRKLRFEARHDTLTGLYNKNTFCNETEALINAYPELDFYLVRWDVDNFKVYNDLYTPEQGDVLLKNLAGLSALPVYQAGRRTVESAFGTGSNSPDGELLLRYGYLGNDHFVFCTVADRDRIKHLVEGLQQQVAATRDNFMLVARAGVYHVVNRNLSVAIMCDRALIALRSTKGNQLNTIGWYDEEMRSRIWEEQWLTSRMQDAMKQGRFEVWFQPIYNCAAHKFAMVEALARWRDPERGLIAPGLFVPVFEKNSSIIKVDTYIWERAMEWLHLWLAGGYPPLVLTINLSRVDVYYSQLRDILLDLSARYQIPRNLLSLEITESAYAENPARFIQVLQQLRQDGFLLAMDDFGSGYSSLTALKELPIHSLKLDLNFSTKQNSSAGGKILQSLVRMAKWLGLSLVAEGTETAEAALFLESLGCDYLQGFYFARPMPGAQLKDFLLKQGVARLEIKSQQEQMLSVKDFWNPDNAVSAMFNSIAGAFAIVEYSNRSLQFLRLCPDFFERLQLLEFKNQGVKGNLLDLVYEEDRDFYLDKMEEAVRTRRELTWEFRVHLGGTAPVYWLKNSIHLIFQQQSQAMFFLLTENITQVKLRLQDLQIVNDRMARVMNHLPVGIAIFRVAHGHFYELAYNRMAMHFTTGKSSGGEIGLADQLVDLTKLSPLEDQLFHRIYWEDVHQMQLNLLNWQATGTGNFIFRALRFDGKMRYLRVNLFRVNQTVPKETYYDVVGAFTDVTAQQEQETSALSLAGRYRLLMEQTTSVTFDYDVVREFMDCNITGTENQLYAKKISRFRSFINKGRFLAKADRPYFIEMLDYVSSRAGKGNFEFKADLGRGPRWYRAHCVSLANGEDVVYRLVGRLEDIQADKESSESLRHKAAEDLLTGAYNRINCELLINRELLKNPLSGHSIIEIDVDNFKLVNDTLGHPTGDQVLQVVANVLKRLGRWTDIVGRLGGDEFLIFLPELSNRRVLVQKLEELLRESRKVQERMNLDVPVTLSVGAVMLKPGVCDFKEAFALVDKALYQAKKNGKNQYYLETEPVNQPES